ncbi:Lysm domain-containing gpi-anchored protein [Thalictrum thalictroides]|uniref:Lysm domain-containing gpi-anchored protein n=1 Tax=Thalictrum thalictroides TaxID=46969 RepID=A0A7J6WP10_THATH|nr:Lysm domain-containing gpi-anchored protein [Thalictrum thalictroides]
MIADEYGTTEATLLRLNGLANPNDLQADSVLDVPLKVCTSMISTTSLDYPLLVPNGTYTFTANNCVQCKCDASNNWTLQCEPSPNGVKIANWTRCPSTQCQNNPNLSIGNTSSSNCGPACSYAGYNSQTILTTAVSSTCPTTDGAQRPSNGAIKIGLRWLSGIWLLIALELGILGFGLL